MLATSNKHITLLFNVMRMRVGDNFPSFDVRDQTACARSCLRALPVLPVIWLVREIGGSLLHVTGRHNEVVVWVVMVGLYCGGSLDVRCVMYLPATRYATPFYLDERYVTSCSR